VARSENSGNAERTEKTRAIGRAVQNESVTREPEPVLTVPQDPQARTAVQLPKENLRDSHGIKKSRSMKVFLQDKAVGKRVKR
jgi:hypothetical protein